MIDPADRHRQRAADGPEHDDEGRRRQERRGHAGGEIDRRIGRDAQILGDAIFRILVIAADQIELVIAAVASASATTTELVSQARQRRWMPIRAKT